MEKKEGQKSRGTIPLRLLLTIVYLVFLRIATVFYFILKPAIVFVVILRVATFRGHSQGYCSFMPFSGLLLFSMSF
jgi:fatty acid desaturase